MGRSATGEKNGHSDKVVTETTAIFFSQPGK